MNYSKETNAGQVGLEKHLQTSLNSIERKAKYNKNHKFQNIYRLLNKWTLGQSWQYINKRASKGIDKISAKEFEANLTEEVTILEEELKKGSYHTNLVKRTYISKPNGGQRPLGIPTVRDKLLQTTSSKILEAIYEPKFYNTRYGYRKGKGAKEAVKHLSKELNYGKYGYIVEADIKGYFQNIKHEKLKEMLSHDIEDKPFLRLINKWLKAGIMTEENIVKKPHKGTPQGGVISPILANIYLHYVLDIWFEKVVKNHIEGEGMMISYADDFVCAFRYKL
ncbi:reverse transcriptase domain-containing protein [Maledivibacter halophilus]|uniref:Group II intron reverse transcriptase/maturase n=1 Tax=Maledivibacter halophilus TaxID=36842 RepID=A0A1T5LP61_9FIRM|nr:reverse transcriptase domain-containing protein [Maledivibacter halophilus]SKC77328.1 group II intron reverse transcriptase/maturase [Maledivibacter halophilus]